MRQTNQEISMTFRGEEIVIPTGTRVTQQTALGHDDNYNFIDDLSWHKPHLKGFARTMALHDMVHYGIDIDSKFVNK
jgi:hypothetical protein